MKMATEQEETHNLVSSSAVDAGRELFPSNLLVHLFAAPQQVEFEWVLNEEVHAVLKQLNMILMECSRRFPMPQHDSDGAGRKVDKFVLTVPQDQLKCVVTLTGDAITHADITFKVQRHQHQHQVQRTYINQESPWKLPQVQDAANHLYQAIHHIENVDDAYNFK